MLNIEWSLLTQEETIDLKKTKREISIGIPKEKGLKETRVSLIPKHVQFLIKKGCKVMVETGAGLEAGFQDHCYKKVGATITSDTTQVFGCDMVSKIAIPSVAEINQMKMESVLLSEFQLRFISKPILQKLLEKGIVCVGFEQIRDYSNERAYYRSMCELYALSLPTMLSSIFLKRKKLLGGLAGFSATKVGIFGAGIMGDFIARMFAGLGSRIYAFDTKLSNLRKLSNAFDYSVATIAMPDAEIAQHIEKLDLILFTKEFHKDVLDWDKDMLSHIQKDSIVLDFAWDYRGNLSLGASPTEVIGKCQHFHYGYLADLASVFPMDASAVNSHFLLTYALNILNEGGLDLFLRKDTGFAEGVMTYKGAICHPILAEYFELPHHKIEYLINNL